MTILITGASRGIGRQLAADYAAAGETVIGTMRSPGDLSGVTVLPLEVTDPESHNALARRLDGKAIDTLICNAGIYPDKGQTLETGFPHQAWDDGFATNVTGVFLTIQTLLPNLRAAQTPKIAIISSMMASHERAPGGSYIYRASKAAVLNLGRNLATDLKPQGIAVGIYHPGWVRTDMGGAEADIDLATASDGLRHRFAALDPTTTGCFEGYDGSPLPY
ncbi:SDR family oxidoreductase [Actibacterium ureilyticum]|uniref:SDR family oxidoreductase n=1 Tax=Actibacterium ureilyticum TaxID=1590614 RepID=UPI000BAAB455|nr:SDR family oxidoreductase [Actibacterium ureilyticum]